MVSSHTPATQLLTYGALAALLLPSLICRADSVVVASNSPHWPVGRVVATGEAVGLAAGERLSLLTASGRTLLLTGAYHGPVTEDGGGDGRAGVAHALAHLLRHPDQDSSALGATRALPTTVRPAAFARLDPSTLVVDVRQSHVYCVAPWQRVTVARPSDHPEAEMLILTDASSGSSTTLQWGSGGEPLAWPASMPVAGGRVVMARASALAGPVELVFKAVAIRHQDLGQMAVRLIEAHCMDQARGVLGALQREAKSELTASGR